MEQWSKRSKKQRADYLSAFGALIGEKHVSQKAMVPNQEPFAQAPSVAKAVPKKKRQQPEREEQVKFVVWLAKQGFRFNASAAGGSRNLYEAMNFKRMGVSKGYPDLEVPLPIAPYHGFYIEFKSHSGKVSPEQKEWLAYLKEKMYYAEVAYSFEEAKRHFEHYLSFMPSAA